MVPWGFCCIKLFLTDVAIALSTFSMQTSPAPHGQLLSLQGDVEACSMAVTQTLHRTSCSLGFS